jgi:hypothetical protein
VGVAEATTIYKTDISTSAQTDTTLWDPAANKRIRLRGCMVSADKAAIVQFEVSNVDVIPPLYLISHGTVSTGPGNPYIWEGLTDEILTYTTTANSPAYGSVSVLCFGDERN